MKSDGIEGSEKGIGEESEEEDSCAGGDSGGAAMVSR